MFSWFQLLVLYTVWPCVWPFRICAFNGQHFGEKKAANDDILNVVVKVRRGIALHLTPMGGSTRVVGCSVSLAPLFSVCVQIVRRCDICLLQEVHDPKAIAVPKLMAALNR